MSFKLRHTDDLIRIAHAGGGFRLDAKLRQTNDLIRIAHAASTSGAKITFSGLNLRHTDDLIRIAHAGKGNIVLEG
jgi:DNA replication protein